MLFSASSWNDRIQCPYSHHLRHTRRLVKRAELVRALEFGKAWHEATNSFLSDGEISEIDPLLDGMFNHWHDHNFRLYPHIHDHEEHGRMAYGEILYVVDLKGKMSFRALKNLPYSARCGVIDTLVFDGAEWWIIERKTTSLTAPTWGMYRAGIQYAGYVAVADEITRLTGFPCRIVYDVARKAIPKDLEGLVCRKCHGDNPACPQCFGTNVIGVSKSVTDTTMEKVKEFAAKYPHVNTVEIMEKISEQGERFNWWFEDTPEDRDYARSVNSHLHTAMRNTRTSKLRTFIGCADCQFREACMDPALEPFALTTDHAVDESKPASLPAECAFSSLCPFTVGEVLEMTFHCAPKRGRKAMKS